MMEETTLGHVQCHCSDPDDGIPDVGVSLGLGEGSSLWIGELLKADGGDIGIVFHGPDGVRMPAVLWPNCEWQDAADLLRHQVGPILARLAARPSQLAVAREVLEKHVAALGFTSIHPEHREVVIAAMLEFAADAGPGWRVVPVEPTPAMIAKSGNTEQRARDDWARMLSAAPTPDAKEAAPSPATFASDTNKDRSGKHGSEVA